jgi:hypothetical protein
VECEHEFGIIGDNEVYNSTTNTTVTMASVTNAEERNRILFSHGVIRMNDSADTALDSADEIFPVEFELSVNRNMRATYDRSSKNLANEPCNDGKPEFRLRLRFAKTENNLNLLDFVSGTVKKLDMRFTGQEIESGENYEFNVSIPYAKIDSDVSPTAEGIIDETVEFVLLATDTAPDGMTGITEAIGVEVKNTETADVLA